MLNTPKDSKISLYISESSAIIRPRLLRRTNHQSNGCTGEGFKKDTVPVSTQKTSQNRKKHDQLHANIIIILFIFSSRKKEEKV